jgi:hypothetical protein
MRPAAVGGNPATRATDVVDRSLAMRHQSLRSCDGRRFMPDQGRGPERLDAREGGGGACRRDGAVNNNVELMDKALRHGRGPCQGSGPIPSDALHAVLLRR